MRNQRDALIDRLLLLYTVECGNQYGLMDGPFKLMKIPLMAELDSVADGINTFSYTFFRYNYGPMTTEIYEDVQELQKLDLLDVPEKGQGAIRLTRRGADLLKSISDLYEKNARICQYIERSAKSYAPMRFGELKAVVYNREVDICGTVMKIADVPHFCDVVSKLEHEGILCFDLDDDWLDSLWGEFHYTAEEKELATKIHPSPVYA